MIKCSECPRCKDTYPDRVDYNGNHFCICGMTGNMVYTEPRRERKHNGKGWVHFSESSCGLFDIFEDAWVSMTQSEQRQYLERSKDGKEGN